MLNKDLEKLGLNKKEAQVYLSLLELGETTIQRISEKSGVRRTTLYDIMASLKQKSLIGITSRKKRTFYYAEDPRNIEKQLDEKKLTLKIILPELLSMSNLLDRKPKIRYFEGIDSAKEVYRDTLNYPHQEILAWVSPQAIKHFDIEYLWKTYVPLRVKNKIWSRSIAPDHPELRHVQNFDKDHLRQTRLYPPDFPAFDVEINLYGGQCIGIMSFEEQLGMIIESKKLFNTLKTIFEMNWKMLESKSQKH